MIIPQFTISQDNKHLIIIIRLPYIKVTNSEVYIEKSTFKFFLHPYLLCITFKNELKEAEEPASA